MKWFLPVLFISYMAGITLFTHSHVVNGVTIVLASPQRMRYCRPCPGAISLRAPPVV